MFVYVKKTKPSLMSNKPNKNFHILISKIHTRKKTKQNKNCIQPHNWQSTPTYHEDVCPHPDPFGGVGWGPGRHNPVAHPHLRHHTRASGKRSCHVDLLLESECAVPPQPCHCQPLHAGQFAAEDVVRCCSIMLLHISSMLLHCLLHSSWENRTLM